MQEINGTNNLNSMAALCEETIGYRNIVDSVFDAMEKQKDIIKHAQLSKAMFDAAKSGNTDILELLLEYHPDLLFEVNSSNQSLLHIAILHRQKSVYKLILSNRAAKNIMTKLVDSDLNTVLHLAGKMGQPQEKPGLSTNHVVMSSEERWFQVALINGFPPYFLSFLHTLLNTFIIF